MIVIVVAALDGWLSVAETVVAPPFSGIESSASASVTVGAASSSVIVPVPVPVPIVAPEALPSVTTTVSSGSSVASPVTDTATVLLVSSAAKVRVPEASAV